MVNFVQGLVNSGELNSVIADSLAFELANINKNLCIQESCLNLENTKVAIDELKTFNHQIETDITTMELSPTSGQKLIDAATVSYTHLDVYKRQHILSIRVRMGSYQENFESHRYFGLGNHKIKFTQVMYNIIDTEY